ncbi:MAG: hypothetical protein ACPLXC_02745 [Candidatus Pacearchaeota archaeon]
MGQRLQTKTIPHKSEIKFEAKEMTFAEELKIQQEFEVQKFKKNYCSSCKNAATCPPFFDFYGNCWGSK